MVAHLSTIVSAPWAATCALFTIFWRLPTRIVRHFALRLVGRDPGTSLWLAFSTSLFSSALAQDERLLLIKPRWMDRLDGVAFPATESEAKEAGFQAYLYAHDGIKGELDRHPLSKADVVWVHVHGGGFKAGEARMYHNTYKRWIRKALNEHGLDLRIVAVEYPLSTEKPYPGSLMSIYSCYKYCLQQQVPSNRIFIVGDSAGGNLAISTTYHILETMPNQLPAATLAFSGWLDLTQEYTGHSPNSATDWLTMMDEAGTKTNVIDRYCGQLIKSRADPRVSPLRRPSLKGLPPQFVSAGQAEVLYMDSRLWADRCLEELGPERTEIHFPKGEVHTFQIGGWLTSTKMRDESDRRILNFIKKHTPRRAPTSVRN